MQRVKDAEELLILAKNDPKNRGNNRGLKSHAKEHTIEINVSIVCKKHAMNLPLPIFLRE